jgi:RNase P/RNase MRP subunit POP5
MMNFEQWMEQAWHEHGDNPQAVAEQLKLTSVLLLEPHHVAELARIVLHVYGEHLGDWGGAHAELALLQEHELCQSDVLAASAVRVSLAALALAQGEVPQGAKLSEEERVYALSAASAVCLGREELQNAADLLALSLKLAALLPQVQAGWQRPLAVAANNLACALGVLAQRSLQQDAQMLQAAQTARQYWALAGDWLEVERADYVLAKSCLRAGQLQQAAQHAAACLSLCREHQAPALELFFAHEIAALTVRALGYDAAFEAARQAALAAFDLLDAQDQSSCLGERDALRV